MELKKLYKDVLGSVGGHHINPRMLYRIFTEPQAGRLFHFLKTEVFFGRVVNAVKRQQQSFFLPKSIVIEPTYQCNLECTQCYAPKKDLTMTSEFFESIIVQAEKMGIYRFVLMGGEPTLEKARNAVLPTIRAHKNSSFLFCTNATRIDDSLIRDFQSVKNANFIISTEGSESYTDARRGPGTYAGIMDGMERLKQANIGFATSVTMNAATWEDQIPEDYFKSYARSGGIVVYTYFIFDPKEQKHEEIDKIKYFRHLDSMVRKYGIYIGDGQYGKILPGKIVPRSNNQVVIDPQGAVRPHRFMPEPVFGSLADERLQDILKKPELIEFKKQSKLEALESFSDIQMEMKRLKIELIV
jgi:MoaA/NifB/PqqE/SkfB family radical SAM enzyme